MRPGVVSISSRRAVLLLLQLSLAVGGSAADRDRLLFRVETIDGKVLASQGPDEPFNPA